MKDYDPIDDVFDEEEAPEESSNRTFLLAAGALGVLILVALLCVVGYVFISANSSRANEAARQTQAALQEMTIQAALTQTAVVQAQQPAITEPATSTNTPVIVEATPTPSETPDPATATVGAAFTQIAASTQTIIPTSTALPNTGFADEAGLPAMFVIALALVVVILLVRRMRTAPLRS
jgi:uncharacterized protein (UPF0333 family)